MIEIIKIDELKESDYVKPKRVFYKQNGTLKSWDMVETFDSVAILIYHTQKDAFVLVKQFRPAVYFKNGDGFTHELCAGIIDKKKTNLQIAQEEILEETGYSVSVDDIEQINSFFTSVGFAGGKQHLYYCEVNEKQRVHKGGGIDLEEIEVVYLPLKDARDFIKDSSKAKTPGLLYAFSWFFENKKSTQAK